MKLTKYTIEDFISELASSSPAPGGGSVAALCGALGAALASMVANLTVGREKFKEAEPAMKSILERSAALRQEFLSLIDEDSASFDAYMTARRMPKETEAEKAERAEAMATAAARATLAPLRTLELCVELALLSLQAERDGNPNLRSDAGVAAALARAVAISALYNVRVNLPAITDPDFAEHCRARAESALAEILRISEEVELRMRNE